MLLSELRSHLERVWDGSTAYGGMSPDLGEPPSKGQCGVTSAYLGRLLERRGLQVYYCEGDVYFDSPEVADLPHHCWLLIPVSPTNRRLGVRRPVVVDLTADQTPGFEEEVVIGTPEELLARGIRYLPKRSRLVSRAEDPGLLGRLGILSSRLGVAPATLRIDEFTLRT